MRVNPRDGQCRECGGELDITDVDDVTMEVQCTQCGDTYSVETDAFGDGCMTYRFNMMFRKMHGEGGES